MHPKKINFDGSKDLISSLPDDLKCHILSFLPTTEVVSTSLLSKRWNNLFAFVPNLEFDDVSTDTYRRMSKFIETIAIANARRFMDFVDSVLASQGNAKLNRFHLKCEYVFDLYRIFEWVPKVLERGVSDLHLDICSPWEYYYSWSHYNQVPSAIFTSKTLAKLIIEHRYGAYGVTIDLEDEIFLPKLKSFHLDDVSIKNSMLVKLLSGCPVLEELVLIHMMCDFTERFTLYSTTLKRLKFHFPKDKDSYMSFDIPNLVYFEYVDTVSLKFPQVRFDSLVEASLGFGLTESHMYEIIDAKGVEAEASRKMRNSSVTKFLMGICNVKTLHLFHDTVEVLNFCCETIPVFKNLIHLSIKTHQVRWKSLIALLKSSPDLKTIIFEISHISSKCKLLKHFSNRKYHVDKKDRKDVPTCLSSSPVKLLKILNFGEICKHDCDKIVNLGEQIKQIKYFLKTMPNLKEMILNYDTSNDEDVIKVSKQLQRLRKVASSKCKIQVISQNHNISFTIPIGSYSFQDSFGMDMSSYNDLCLML